MQVKKIDEGFREVQDRMATKTTLVVQNFVPYFTIALLQINIYQQRLLDERLPPHSTMVIS